MGGWVDREVGQKFKGKIMPILKNIPDFGEIYPLAPDTGSVSD
jgi:hypothetical protein